MTVYEELDEAIDELSMYLSEFIKALKKVDADGAFINKAEVDFTSAVLNLRKSVGCERRMH
jgi:hypothetical protein